MNQPADLVDEFESLENLKKKVEDKIEKLKLQVIQFAREQNTNLLLGTNKKCLVREYEKIIYPEDKKSFTEIIKSKGIYNLVSSINYLKLGAKIKRNEVDNDILNLVKKEKAHRVVLMNKNLLI